MEKQIFCKCKCGEDVMEFDKLYECSKCKSQVWKHSFGKDIKPNEAKKLLEGEKFMMIGFKSHKNTFYDTTASIVDGKVELVFDENTKSTSLFKCECGGDVTKITKGFKCNKCELIVWERFMNKNLSLNQVKKLFYGNGVELHDLKSKKGNIFNAEIFYNNGDISLEYI